MRSLGDNCPGTEQGRGQKMGLERGQVENNRHIMEGFLEVVIP